MQNYRHPVYRLEVVFGIDEVSLYRLWPENNELGNSAGADSIYTACMEPTTSAGR